MIEMYRFLGNVFWTMLVAAIRLDGRRFFRALPIFVIVGVFTALMTFIAILPGIVEMFPYIVAVLVIRCFC